MDKSMKQTIIEVFVAILIMFAIVTFCNSVATVPTGFVGVKTRFGQVQNTVINEGFNFKIPYIEKIVKIDCRTQKTDYTMEASSKDLQKITNLKVSVNYNVTKDSANKLYREVGIDYKTIIVEPAIYEAMKATVANYTAEELITKRSEVSDKMQETLKAKIETKGFNVVDFNIIDLDFSAAYNQAIEKKAVAQQEVETAKANLEKQQIENQQRISVAETDAKVMELQNSKITENTLRLKELENQEKFINKWNGAMPSTMLSDGMSTMFNINR